MQSSLECIEQQYALTWSLIFDLVMFSLVILWCLNAYCFLQMFFVQVCTVTSIILFKIFSYFCNHSSDLVSLTKTLLTNNTFYYGYILSLFHIQTESKVKMTVLIRNAAIYIYIFR